MAKRTSMKLHGVTIAFDLDGTLVDTAPDLIGALNVVLDECGLPALPLEAARALVGGGARALIERGFFVAGRPLDADHTPKLVARFIDVYRGRIADESRPFKGLDAALDTLRDDGAILCVCTNKPTELSHLLLRALKLDTRFASVVGADAAPERKPHPSHFMAAVEQAGGDPRRAIMVGDSETDVLTARAAGAPVIVVPFGYTTIAAEALGGDVLIQHFSELPAAIDRLLPALNRARASAIGSPSRTPDMDA
jgi:phosphoglycolate phosphatase